MTGRLVMGPHDAWFGFRTLGPVPINGVSLRREIWFNLPNKEVAMRRHELSSKERSIIEPLLPRKSWGVKRVDDRRVINGILWRFRIGSSWRDVPERYGPRTTLYNRFCR